MKVLILGGTGLISTAITRDLLARGDEVTLLHRNPGSPTHPVPPDNGAPIPVPPDRGAALPPPHNRDAASPAPHNRDAASAAPHNGDVTLPAPDDDGTPLSGSGGPGSARSVRGDRGHPEALRAAWGDGHDAVIDMLCFTPADVNVALTAFGDRVPHYIMCSTVDVYTKPARYLPVDEHHERNPDKRFPYARDKQLAEQRLLDSGVPLTILRPAATYLDTAVPSYGSFDLAVERLRAGLPVILHGNNFWATCHRDDVARAFVSATAVPPAGRAYNVTGHERLTFEQYWRAVADALDVKPNFIRVPPARIGGWCELNFQFDNVFDCSAAAHDLGFASTVPWAEGITHALRHRPMSPVTQQERDAYEELLN
ncbi:NAD(P)H-binding protein [Paractinoplanes lichenicola]|uniref:NAD(P)H-binding protein n=1 Tax=Paractinoplanes lichenicola TaxID=2802976 RepID=A0ABS1VGF9_9ACTN|nr:NAD(P)H-binding protein [Actinoplanes lichenicola]MBL7253244.1 NAD(P)H-binding protein [Actinoplanes lichenicola]